MTAPQEPGPVLKEGAFLKELIAQLGHAECRQLHRRLANAEREERCIRRAMFLMIVLLMLSLAGLGYFAILVPEVFHDSENVLVRGLSCLGLGSLIAQAGFLGYLLWHRAGVTRLHEECRLLILALARSQLGLPAVQVLAQSPPNHAEHHRSIPGLQDPRPLAPHAGPSS